MAEIVNRLVPLAACRPHPQNYNRHDAGQIADLRRSLRAFGQVRSIVVQADGADGCLIVAGHGLVAAAQAEGWQELRADVVPAEWPAAKVLAYLAADNELAYLAADNELARRGDPDEGQLAALVAQVAAEADANLASLAAGSEARLAEMLAATLQDVAEDGGTRSGLGTPSLIRLVVDVADVGIVERAIAATEEANRGAALMAVCRSYLRAKGQLDGAAEDPAPA